MKQLFSLIYFVSAASCVTALLACSGSGGKSGKEAKYRIPWPKADHSGYEIQVITLKTLTDPYKLKGAAAKVLFEPRGDAQFDKNESRLRYIEDGDVLVPADTATLQMTAVYAHHEKFLEMDEAVGVVKDLQRPRKIGVNVKLSKEQGEDEHVETDNALYFPKTDTILIVPYTKENVPLTLNAGVLAHEYFHGLFQALIYNRLKNSKIAFSETAIKPRANDGGSSGTVSNEEFNAFVLRALNEGLADFWAWVYLGDDDFMSHSLPKNAKNRRLDTESLAFPQSEDLKKTLSVLSETKVLGLAYRIGTNYARFFRNLTVEDGLSETREGRAKVARKMIQSLRKFGERLEAASGDRLISPQEIIEIFAQDHPGFLPKSCPEFKKVLVHSEFGGC